MTATSVSITVASLQELGYLKSETGTTIMSAAIIDDVIGIIVLTFVVGMKDPDSKPMTVIISTVLFFAAAVIFGVLIYQLFKNWTNVIHTPAVSRSLALFLPSPWPILQKNIFWYCRYHRRLCSRYRTLQY